MHGVTRKDIDTAGGRITSGSPDVFINGYSAVRKTDTVESHGWGQHSDPTIATGSPDVFVNGLPLCRAALDKATCDDIATGSTDVFCN